MKKVFTGNLVNLFATIDPNKILMNFFKLHFHSLSHILDLVWDHFYSQMVCLWKFFVFLTVYYYRAFGLDGIIQKRRMHVENGNHNNESFQKS